MNWVIAHSFITNDINHVYILTEHYICNCHMSLEAAAVCGRKHTGDLIVDHNNKNGLCEQCQAYLTMLELAQ